MSTVVTVIKRLEKLAEHPHVNGYILEEIHNIKDLLADKTVLLIEWNEIDIQRLAREKLANLDNVPVEQIIEEPLSKDDVEEVIRLLERCYDADQGVTYETIVYALDHIVLPGPELCRKEKRG